MRAGWRWGWAALTVLALAACDGGTGTPTQTLPPVEEEPDIPPPDVPPPTVDSGPWALDLARGQTLFIEKCQGCHGENGGGGYGPALNNTGTCPPCAEFTRLWQRIDEFMPFRNPEACDAQCSRDIASWIMNGFSTMPSCTVSLRYDSITADRFTATVSILNYRGQDVSSWRLGFTLPAGHAITSSNNVTVSQGDNLAVLSSHPPHAAIANGATVEVGLQGTHPGSAVVPVDLRLEASPCFTALAPQ